MAQIKRKIIRIDEAKCDGCGDCITACAEGALVLIDGKAKLVREDFCDGFGDCVGNCHTGALVIEEREAADFNLAAVREHVRSFGGPAALDALEEAYHRHENRLKVMASVEAPIKSNLHHGGCPGSAMRMGQNERPAAAPAGSGGPTQAIPSELNQWPVQLHLVRPDAPFFKNKELVVMSTCGPIASADVHWRFLRGRSVVVGCPKLDDTSGYAEKLAAILAEPSISKAIVVRMEVPCCGGLTGIVSEAVRLCGRSDLVVEEVSLSLSGDYQYARQLN